MTTGSHGAYVGTDQTAFTTNLWRRTNVHGKFLAVEGEQITINLSDRNDRWEQLFEREMPNCLCRVMFSGAQGLAAIIIYPSEMYRDFDGSAQDVKIHMIDNDVILIQSLAAIVPYGYERHLPETFRASVQALNAAKIGWDSRAEDRDLVLMHAGFEASRGGPNRQRLFSAMLGLATPLNNSGGAGTEESNIETEEGPSTSEDTVVATTAESEDEEEEGLTTETLVPAGQAPSQDPGLSRSGTSRPSGGRIHLSARR